MPNALQTRASESRQKMMVKPRTLIPNITSPIHEEKIS